MRSAGERDREVVRLLDALEELAQAYRRVYGSKPLADERRRQARQRKLREGRILEVAGDWLVRRRSRKQNRAMEVATRARRAAKGSAAPVKPQRFSNERIAVYTCLFGPYDPIREPVFAPDNVDYFIVTDQPIPAGSRFKALSSDVIPVEADTPVLRNRWVKMHPHELFPEYDCSIYLDASCWVFSDLTPLIATLDEFPVALFPHKRRDCVYDEVEACLTQRKDDPAALKAHRRALVDHGVPRNIGLLEATAIARRHRDPRCIELMDAWWQEFLRYSKRDQIGLVDVLWQHGIAVDDVAGLARCGVGGTLAECNLFLVMPHTG